LAAKYRPQLTNAARPATFEVEAYNERGEMVPTSIAGEHPLTLYVDKREIVTLMTLGHAPEALIIGYLRNQRLVQSLEEIRAVQVDWETDSVAVTTSSGKELQLGKRTVTSGCGQGTVFGDLMEEIDTIRLRDDAIAGYMWLDAIDGSDKVFYTTGRLTSEMVIKCAQMRIPFLVSRSGLTQMGHAIAKKVGITMLGRASGKHYLAFTGRERIVRTAAQPTALA
jgi:FdhD protein